MRSAVTRGRRGTRPSSQRPRNQGRSELVDKVSAGPQCILSSALDAYIRHFEVVVPPDAVAAIHRDLHDAALQMMRLNMAADLASSADVRLS